MGEAIPVIDLFAGPGGLGEGFSSYRPNGQVMRSFKIVVSVEKDPWAHRTLLLRSFYRQFSREVPDEYYQYLRGEITHAQLFEQHAVQALAARAEAMFAELGKHDHIIYERIARNLDNTSNRNCVLIGGPPCQAYSIVGRSRMKDSFSTDQRQVLYQEYLKIIARFRPVVFVMENVKGMLSSQARLDENARPHIGGTQERIFDRILRDLKHPVQAVHDVEDGSSDTLVYPELNQAGGDSIGYDIYSLVVSHKECDGLRPSDFIVRSEEFGVPQTRHRVILVGVRSDIDVRPDRLVRRSIGQVPIEDVIGDLPRLRSQLSKRRDQDRDSPETWGQAVRRILDANWLKGGSDNDSPIANMFDWLDPRNHSDSGPSMYDFRCALRAAAEGVVHQAGTGGAFTPGEFMPAYRPDWYHDPRLGGVCNHESRSHMLSDLHRYLFLACYGRRYSVSPTIRTFPTELLPAHRNIKEHQAGEEDVFDDRFRVQVAGKPATTITSHISKDGHYYIHYDPFQCRSLTVREAARIQTFPDNYFFEGPRTEQYHQVGNAVPPLLAYQIAQIVYDVLETMHDNQ